jgi:hypothetical protein
VLPGGSVAFDRASISPDLVDGDEPKLCPDPRLDKLSVARGRKYEDYVKSVVNPGNPTPSGFGFQLPNPKKFSKLVCYDDCEHATGTKIEAKGPEYAGLLTFKKGRDSVIKQFLKQSGRQVAARGWRRVRWYFAEPETRLLRQTCSEQQIRVARRSRLRSCPGRR